MLPRLLHTLEFRSNNDMHRPVIAAMDLLRRHADSKMRVYPLEEDVPFDDNLAFPREAVTDTDKLWRSERPTARCNGNGSANNGVYSASRSMTPNALKSSPASVRSLDTSDRRPGTK
jgi:hypothetical protein